MKQIPEIMTGRLCLRGFTRDDAEDVFRYASDPTVLFHTTGETPRSVEDSRKFVDSLLNNLPGAYAWAIRLKNEFRVIGAVEFGLEDGRNGSIHYALAKEYWNRGLMTEACRAVLDWGFSSHPGLQSVTTSAVTANRGSTRVMEKCGMEFQRIVKEKWKKFDEPVELAVYSIDRRRWESSQQLAAGDADKPRA
ncbi:MAG: GNAT family N-acetyltransferase [Candidatus Poribacteria bacterium]|nr:GNAT family N-acetyltransferase [Candidatus Poribacteria bacterium]